MPNKFAVITLDRTINRVVYKMFGCLAAEDINYIRNIVDLPCIEHIVHKHTSKFEQI